MSELAQLTGAVSSVDDALPGYVLSPWSIAEIGEAEQHFEQSHVRTMALGSAAAPPLTQAQMADSASEAVAGGVFCYGGPGFWRRMSVTHELPYILWLSLRAKQSHLTLQAAATLITPENRQRLQLACLQCAGWKPPVAPPNPQGAAGNSPDARSQSDQSLKSPGESSTPSSPSGTSTPQTSEG